METICNDFMKAGGSLNKHLVMKFGYFSQMNKTMTSL